MKNTQSEYKRAQCAGSENHVPIYIFVVVAGCRLLYIVFFLWIFVSIFFFIDSHFLRSICLQSPIHKLGQSLMEFHEIDAAKKKCFFSCTPDIYKWRWAECVRIPRLLKLWIAHSRLTIGAWMTHTYMYEHIYNETYGMCAHAHAAMPCQINQKVSIHICFELWSSHWDENEWSTNNNKL